MPDLIVVPQKSTQHCRVIFLQLKNKIKTQSYPMVKCRVNQGGTFTWFTGTDKLFGLSLSTLWTLTILDPPIQTIHSILSESPKV